MTAPKNTTATAYGLMDSAALQELRSNFDTSRLLRMVDEFDAAASAARGEDSPREMLLRLHSMAHVVINGTGMTVATDCETLPELAESIVDDMRESITRLRGGRSIGAARWAGTAPLIDARGSGYRSRPRFKKKA